MARLEIFLLGAFHVTRGGRAITRLGYDKIRASLAVLAVNQGRPHRREAMASLFWPDQPMPAAPASLRQAVAVLRRAIGDAQSTSPVLNITQHTLHFAPGSAVWVDTPEFSAALRQARRHAHRDAVSCAQCAAWRGQAAELYRGPFLEHFNLNGSAAFDDWARGQRDEFERQALQALFQLTEFHQQQRDYERAQAYAARQLRAAPWREEAHRQMMRLLALQGQRAAALKQYETCRRALDEELGVTPDADTEALHMAIRSGWPSARPTRRPQAPSNLPAPTISFVDRVCDLEAIVTRLSGVFLTSSPALPGGASLPAPVRLLTITGPPGVGETRLSLEGGARLEGAVRQRHLSGRAGFNSRPRPGGIRHRRNPRCPRASRRVAVGWQTDSAQYLEQARAQIGDDRFEALLEEGRALTLDEAVALAQA